jgi:hypothetical protein
MGFGADHAVLLDRLDEALRAAPQPTLELFSKIIASACTRIPILARSGRADRVARLAEAGAWADAALALIEQELPSWKLRRLVCEDGVWLCSLSRQPYLPITLDDTADAMHEVMPLAVLAAFLQARRISGMAPVATSAVPTIRAAAHEMICCDNFA